MGSLPSPPPTPLRDDHAAAASRVYAAFCSPDPDPGECNSNWLEAYTPSDNTWRRVGAIPGIPAGHVLKGFAMVSLGASVYIIGGCLCRKDADAATEFDLAVRADVLCHDAATGEWSARAPLLAPRFDFACAPCDGRIYLAGGLQCCAAAPAAARRGMSAAEVYEPAADRWEPLAPMQTLRYKCVGVTWGGRFIVVGGFAQQEGGGERAAMAFGMERSSAEAFDAGRGEWELRPGMWALDVPPNQVVAVEGRLLSSGDCLNTWKGHVEAYDGKLNMWNMVEGSQLEELTWPPEQRRYLTMAPVGAHLYFLAWYQSGTRSVAVAHAFDTTTATWRCFGPAAAEAETAEAAKELCGHCCVVRL